MSFSKLNSATALELTIIPLEAHVRISLSSVPLRKGWRLLSKPMQKGRQRLRELDLPMGASRIASAAPAAALDP
ncbi:MAG: hypothetical protein V3T83_03705, partial [Acidobacteriota bacterium]